MKKCSIQMQIPQKSSFSGKLGWELLYFLNWHFKCIALIKKILLWCAIFTGLLLSTQTYTHTHTIMIKILRHVEY